MFNKKLVRFVHFQFEKSCVKSLYMGTKNSLCGSAAKGVVAKKSRNSVKKV